MCSDTGVAVQGLGKTITGLALICKTRDTIPTSPLDPDGTPFKCTWVKDPTGRAAAFYTGAVISSASFSLVLAPAGALMSSVAFCLVLAPQTLGASLTKLMLFDKLSSTIYCVARGQSRLMFGPT